MQQQRKWGLVGVETENKWHYQCWKIHFLFSSKLIWSSFRIFISLPVILTADYIVLIRALPGDMVVGLLG